MERMKRNQPSNQMTGMAMIIASMLAVAIAYFVVLIISASSQREIWRKTGVAIAALIAWLPAAWILVRHSSFRAIKMERLAKRAVNAVGCHALIFIAVLYLVEVDDIAVSTLAVFYGTLLIILPSLSIGARSVIKHFRRRGRGVSRVVVVGSDETAVRLCQTFASDPGFGYCLVGVFADTPSQVIDPGLYRGRYEALQAFVRDNDVDEVYCTVSDEDDSVMRLALSVAESNMARCYYVPRLSRYSVSELGMLEIGHMVLFAPRKAPLQTFANRLIKRMCDLILAGGGALMFPIVFIPVAISIKLTSPGPIFYRQRRTGYMGSEFSCLKFRTMRCGDCDGDDDSARVTSVGRFLRHTSIDELPQVFNILAGDMSVVGPRPHMISQTEEYSRLIDRYMGRHSVKPGLTGWAQVNGLRGTTDHLWKMERRVEHDIWYIEHWSLLLDLKIIFRTAVNLLRGDENAF